MASPRGVTNWRQGVTQVVAAGASSATSANPFGNQTYGVRLSANTACHYKVVEAAGGPAAVTDSFLPANQIDTVVVTPGQKISAIQAATAGLITATAGSLWCTELI